MNFHYYLIELLNGFFLNECSTCAKGCEKGRFKRHKDYSKAKLVEEIIKKLLVPEIKKSNAKNDSRPPRTDATLCSVVRKFKKVPDFILKTITSKSMFKSNSLRKFLKTTVRAYFSFLKLYDVPEKRYQDVNLFYDYIMLYCARDIQLFDEFIRYSIDFDDDSHGGYTLFERRQIVYEWTVEKKPLTSKTKINEFYSKNEAFRIIIDQVSDMLTKYFSENEWEHLYGVIQKIQGKK